MTSDDTGAIKYSVPLFLTPSHTKMRNYILTAIFAVLCACSIGFPLQTVFLPSNADASAIVSASVDSRFLQFVAEAAKTILTTRIDSVRLEDSLTYIEVPLLGNVELRVSNVVVKCSPTAGSSSLASLVADDQGRLNFKASGINIAVSARWKWKLGFLGSGGNVNIALLDTEIASSIVLTESPYSNATQPNLGVTTSNSAVNFGRVICVISDSKLAWLYQWLQRQFVSDLRGVIGGVVKQQLDNDIPLVLNKALHAVPSSRQIWKNFYLNFPVTSVPAASTSGININLDFEGRVRGWDGELGQCPYASAQGPILKDADHMLNIRVTEPVFNCILWALHKEKFFEYKFRVELGEQYGSLDHQLQIASQSFTDSQSLKEEDNSVPRIEFDLLLPANNTPSMNLLDSGKLKVTIPKATVNILVYLDVSPDAPPFSVSLGLNTSFIFEPRVLDFSRPSSAFEWSLVHSLVDTTVLKKSGNVDASVLNSLMQWSPMLPLQLATKSLEKIGNTMLKTMTVPIPITLPYPLDVIRISEFGVNISEGLWTIHSDFSLDK